MDVVENQPKTMPLSMKMVENRPNMLRRMLKYALPLPLALLVILGGLYYIGSDLVELLDGYGLFIDPKLQYVSGPPPI